MNLWVVVIGIVVVPGVVRAEETAPDAAAAAKGQVTYTRYCVPCHGAHAKGDGPLANDLRVAVPDLTTLAQRSGGKYPFERVVRVIQGSETLRGHGTTDMPAWGDVFKKSKGTGEATVDAAIRNLSHYLWTMQQPGK
jgi:mono/diheme cytochrome c family protein